MAAVLHETSTRILRVWHLFNRLLMESTVRLWHVFGNVLFWLCSNSYNVSLGIELFTLWLVIHFYLFLFLFFWSVLLAYFDLKNVMSLVWQGSDTSTGREYCVISYCCISRLRTLRKLAGRQVLLQRRILNMLALLSSPRVASQPLWSKVSLVHFDVWKTNRVLLRQRGRVHDVLHKMSKNVLKKYHVRITSSEVVVSNVCISWVYVKCSRSRTGTCWSDISSMLWLTGELWQSWQMWTGLSGLVVVRMACQN